MNLNLMPKALYFALLLFSSSASMALAANFFEEGKIMYETKQFEQAKQCFEAEIKNHPENASAHYFLANVLLQLKQTTNAQKEYEKSEQLDPDGVAGRYSRLALSSILGNLTSPRTTAQTMKANDYQSVPLPSAPEGFPSSANSATITSSKVISKEVTRLVHQQQAECDAKVKEMLAEANDRATRLNIEMQEHIAANGPPQYVQTYVPRWGGGAVVQLVKTYDPEPDNQLIRQEYATRIAQVGQKARHDADQLVETYKQKQLALEDTAITLDKSYLDKNPGGNIIVNPTGTDIYNRNYQTGDTPSGNPVPVMLPPAKLLPGIRTGNNVAQ